MKIFAPSICAALAIALPAAASADPSSCTTVRIGQPPWTDINVTDALAGTVLNAIGYEQKIEPLAVPIIYQALKSNQIDVFQGNWMPAQTHFVTSYKGDFETLGTNLTGAKFTLAVPDYVAAAGVHSIADLKKYADKFGEKIYGIDPGAPANKNISNMIADNAYPRDTSPVWPCATFFKGRNHRISTKEEGLDQAKRVAEEWYIGLRGKDKAGKGGKAATNGAAKEVAGNAPTAKLTGAEKFARKERARQAARIVPDDPTDTEL